MELTRSQIKDIKGQLKHLNDVYYVFKYRAIQKQINEDSISNFIQELLRSYTITNVLITKEQIEKSKELLNEI